MQNSGVENWVKVVCQRSAEETQWMIEMVGDVLERSGYRNLRKHETHSSAQWYSGIGATSL